MTTHNISYTNLKLYAFPQTNVFLLGDITLEFSKSVAAVAVKRAFAMLSGSHWKYNAETRSEALDKPFRPSTIDRLGHNEVMTEALQYFDIEDLKELFHTYEDITSYAETFGERKAALTVVQAVTARMLQIQSPFGFKTL
jgi:hypothetical protein